MLLSASLIRIYLQDAPGLMLLSASLIRIYLQDAPGLMLLSASLGRMYLQGADMTASVVLLFCQTHLYIIVASCQSRA